MGNFWPTLPFFIPKSQGMPLWFDLFWWAFQIVIMTTLLLSLRRWGMKLDADREKVYRSRVNGQPLTNNRSNVDQDQDKPPEITM